MIILRKKEGNRSTTETTTSKFSYQRHSVVGLVRCEPAFR